MEVITHKTFRDFACKLFLVYKVDIVVPVEFINRRQKHEYIATAIFIYMARYIANGIHMNTDDLSSEDIAKITELCNIYRTDIRIQNENYNKELGMCSTYATPTFASNEIYEPIQRILNLNVLATDFVMYGVDSYHDIREITIADPIALILLEGLNMYRNENIELKNNFMNCETVHMKQWKK